MRRISRITLLAGLVSCGAAWAGPVLLGSFDFDAQVELPVGTRVGFALALLDLDTSLILPDPPLGGLRIDRGVQPTMFWGNGESGVLEFTSATDPGFDDLASFVTDGIDDSLVVFWNWRDGGAYEGYGLRESQRFGLESDLVGNDIDLIRLTVHEVSLDPLGGDLVSVQTHVTYDFYGSPIPEPATLVLLMAGFPVLMRRVRTRVLTSRRSSP